MMATIIQNMTGRMIFQIEMLVEGVELSGEEITTKSFLLVSCSGESLEVLESVRVVCLDG